MIHFNDGGNTLCAAEPQNGDVGRIGDRVSIKRDDLEGMARQGQAANFGRAAIQNVKEDTLALLNSNRLAVAEHATINCEELVANFVAVRHAFGEGRFHCRFACLLESFLSLGRRQKILWHVAAATQSWLKFLQDKKHFAIIAAWIFFRLGVNRPDLAAVLASREIRASAIVGVIETQAGWIGRERDAAMTMRRNVRRALLGGAIDLGGDFLAMPMQLLGCVCFVGNFHRYLTAFLKADERTGELTIVCDS